ncbi:MAG: glycosyltransferase family 4 protein, partial [Flavobacterium sp.]
SICEKKGVRQLIQAFILVKQKYPSLYLDLYGRDWFWANGASYTKYLKDIFSESDLEQVCFHNSIPHDQLPEKIQSATLCVFPSHMETLGLVAPEAMAMEKAVIFTNLGPGKEVIEDGVTGMLCNPLAPEDIAFKIMQLLQDPEYAKTLGKNARKAAVEKFYKNVILLQNIDFYQSILK